MSHRLFSVEYFVGSLSAGCLHSFIRLYRFLLLQHKFSQTTSFSCLVSVLRMRHEVSSRAGWSKHCYLKINDADVELVCWEEEFHDLSTAFSINGSSDACSRWDLRKVQLQIIHIFFLLQASSHSVHLNSLHFNFFSSISLINPQRKICFCSRRSILLCD